MATRASAGVAAPAVANGKCVSCSESEAGITLHCDAKHKMCQSCLSKNAERFGTQLDRMYLCPKCLPTSPTSQEERVWIFADTSNIWIEAKKHASRERGFESKEDNRLRIDVGRLMQVVSGSRKVGKGTIYGSRPPEIDTFWESCRGQEWEVKVNERSRATGKEKEVDSEMVVDIVTCDGPVDSQDTIIVISGDRDFCPPILNVLKDKLWRVETYVWRNAHTLIERLEGFSKEYPSRLKCYFLEDYTEKFTYFNRKLSEKTQKERIKDCSAVVTIKDGHTAKEVIKNEEWWQKVESVTKWPVEYKWPLEQEDDMRHLLLVFRGMRNDMVEAHVKAINNPPNEAYNIPHVERCELYSSFKAKVKRGRSRHVTDEEGWTTVVGRDPPKSVAAAAAPSAASVSAATSSGKCSPQNSRPTTRCCSGKNCASGVNCKFSHTKDERNYFERREGGGGNVFRKTRMCNDYCQTRCCKYSSVRCEYAHEVDDRWCMNCHTYGHFKGSCTNPRCQHPSHSQIS